MLKFMVVFMLMFAWTTITTNAAYAQVEPGSKVYYDVHSGAATPDRNYRLKLPGSVINEKGAEIITVRGWLRTISGPAGQNCSDDPSDFSYDLELDPTWLDSKGIDPNRIVRADNASSNRLKV